MTLQERVLAAVPRGGIAAKDLYRQMRPALPGSVDAAILGLLNGHRLVRVGTDYRQPWDCRESGADSEEPAAVHVGMQRCRRCREILPLTRFGRHRLGKPWTVCFKCHSLAISAGAKARRAQGGADAVYNEGEGT